MCDVCPQGNTQGKAMVGQHRLEQPPAHRYEPKFSHGIYEILTDLQYMATRGSAGQAEVLPDRSAACTGFEKELSPLKA